MDSYSVEGSPPLLVSVFEYVFRGERQLFTIVSWDVNHQADGTQGRLYQVYGCKKDGKGGLEANKSIATSNLMTGIEGEASGEESHFGGKTAAEVKRLLDHMR